MEFSLEVRSFLQCAKCVCFSPSHVVNTWRLVTREWLVAVGQPGNVWSEGSAPARDGGVVGSSCVNTDKPTRICVSAAHVHISFSKATRQVWMLQPLWGSHSALDTDLSLTFLEGRRALVQRAALWKRKGAAVTPAWSVDDSRSAWRRQWHPLTARLLPAQEATVSLRKPTLLCNS